MELPNDSIGVSDLKGWQECPRRMSYQMKRWTEEGEPPESHANPHTRYGTAVHDGIQFMEETDAAPEEVVQFLMSNGHRWIDPQVSDELIADLEEHRNRDEPLEWRLLWNEREIRVPLVVHEGVRIFYRARIDRLYQHREWPGRYRLRDTKTSRWMRTKDDVDRDEQMSAYDWAVREYLPEVEELEIVYDQLRFGEVTSRRSDDDRRKIKRWLQMGAIAVLDDDEYGPDGLLVPEFNQFCAYCPILTGCSVVPMLTNYAQAEIARLAPEVKDGRTLRPQLDPDVFDVYVDQLPAGHGREGGAGAIRGRSQGGAAAPALLGARGLRVRRAHARPGRLQPRGPPRRPPAAGRRLLRRRLDEQGSSDARHGIGRGQAEAHRRDG
jgi:hypothetical protein